MIELGHLGMVPACGLVLMTREENREGQLDSVHPYNFSRLFRGGVFAREKCYFGHKQVLEGRECGKCAMDEKEMEQNGK